MGALWTPDGRLPGTIWDLGENVRCFIRLRLFLGCLVSALPRHVGIVQWLVFDVVTVEAGVRFPAQELFALFVRTFLEAMSEVARSKQRAP